jgi:hypothetical protein
MNNLKLSDYFSLERRYSRSINLERDLDDLSALDGYILTDKAIDTLGRTLRGLTTENNNNNCWTLTGVYGTGKSAFAHYFISLLAPQQNSVRVEAEQITFACLGQENRQYQELLSNLPKQGLFRAIAVGQREPIIRTIIRALVKGAEIFWQQDKQRKKINVFQNLLDLETEINQGNQVDTNTIISLVKKIITKAKTDLIFVIDELGKNLEYAVYNQGAEDLYLLQQLAELDFIDNHRVYILGILHQAFTEYGQRLANVQRNEWAKIQGRFEDIPFTPSAGQMMRLMGQAINHSPVEAIACGINNYSQEWFDCLNVALSVEEVEKSVLEQIYPLHPITALVLPTLCMRYAQNDRSLFTFLTSSEPFSLRNFLEEVEIKGDVLPTLKLDRVYDYFIEAAGMGLASRPNLQRWVEIHDLIADAKRLNHDSLRVLKAIAILNLVTITGVTRATRDLVAYALCDSPNEDDFAFWQGKIDGLLKQGLITHRRQLDELRIWQGSDFNVDSELESYLEQEQSSLVKLLSDLRPLKPIVAQRHSYKTGTLRYFERHYLDSSQDLSLIKCHNAEADGWLGYWLDDHMPPSTPPSTTVDKLPLIIITGTNLQILRLRAREFSALSRMNKEAKQLQSDGVARKEVRYRLREAEKYLDETIATVFDFHESGNQCWIQGKLVNISSVSELNIKLSTVCDKVFPQSPILWNELINRRNLTSQGAKARRELISAMISHECEPKLGLTGYGPEVSMYYSLLQQTEIHRPNNLLPLNAVEAENEEWGFYPPITNKTGNPNVEELWNVIENFCLSAREKPESLDKLYQQVSAPPLGVKEGMIPIMLAAVLLHHRDDVGIYQDGTFVPVLGEQHFELLVKNPERYAVKYFAIAGLRAEVFKELEAILRNRSAKTSRKVRNATLLTVVTPLYQFIRQLPRYTQQTKRLSEEAYKVLICLQKTVEPDELLFKGLPNACDLPSIGIGEGDDGITAKKLKSELIQAFREINTAYDNLLGECQSLLYSAFGVRSEETKLREDLRVRANYLRDKCVEPILRRFTQAACDQSSIDTQWLEALVMIVADKPAESWTDEDVTCFEIKLADVARRFKNLEALQKEVAAKGEGFEARRITVTRPDGKETNRMVWVDNETTEQIESLVNKVLQEPLLLDNPQLQQAFVAKLTEKVLGNPSGENLTKITHKKISKAINSQKRQP